MLDEVCSRTKFYPTCFDAKVWIFHVWLVWWGVSSNIHIFSLNSNVCTLELQFEFLNVFLKLEFRFDQKYLLWMMKAQDHVLQQRRTRYTRYDRESLQKPSERSEELDGWGNISADGHVRRKTLFVGRFWQRVYETGRQRNSLYGDNKFFGTNTASIKAKINGLRGQLGGEVAKVNKTKSGQSTDELYASSWIHYDRLSFLLPVIKSSKSRDTLKRKNDEKNDEV